MKRAFLLALSIVCLFVASSRGDDVCAGSTAENPLKHFIILMMENRSFDHFLGWLKSENSEILGLTGKEYNLVDPNDPDSQKIFVDKLAENVDPDFDHSVKGTSQEIQWGSENNDVKEVLLNGFVAQNIRHRGSSGGPLAMSMFDSNTLPVLSTLATNFANFDQYFADLPGPTMPNRFYFMSGTSHGLANNDDEAIGIGLPQASIFDRLNRWRVDWRVYSESVPSVLGLLRMRSPGNLHKMRALDEFYGNLKSKNLTTVSWVEPSYWAVPDLGIVPTDQHPDHPVEYGEALIKQVYEELRASDYWNCSALLITYDEHGGFADFSPMETENIPNPDGRASSSPPFNFDRLGIRVPFVAVSPWVDPQVVHAPDPSVRPTENSQFTHSSLAATLRNVFKPEADPLTKRTAWAAPYDHVLKQRSSPRTDAPAVLPPVHETAFYKNKPRNPSADLPMNSLQHELMSIARHLCLDNREKCQLPVPSLEEVSEMTEREGGLFAVRVMRSLRS